MISRVRVAALLWPLLLAGCAHKQHQAQNLPLAPPIDDASLPKSSAAPVNLPPPVVTVPKPQPPAATTTAQQEPLPPKPAPKHKKATPKQAPAQPSPQVASNGTPEVSAIGQLSSAVPADLRKITTDSIAETERGLSNISRKLNEQEQKTAAQIREFLKQAKTALGSGDIDGAHTLALKAKVLLSELSQ